MVVVHVASGTRDILVFWAPWPRLWATPYTDPGDQKRKGGEKSICLSELHGLAIYAKPARDPLIRPRWTREYDVPVQATVLITSFH
jgi:hypothetical protein